MKYPENGKMMMTEKKKNAEETAALIQNENFLRKAYLGALIPCALSILSGCINIIVDGILVGQKAGVDGLAAINLCVPVYLVLCVIGSFFVSGTAIPASDEVGKGNMDAAQFYYELALGTCFLSSIVATVLGLLCMPAVASLLSSEEAIRVMIRSYAGITVAGALAKIMIYVPFWFLRLEGKNRDVTVMMVLMGGGNVVLDVLLMYVLDMGVAGAALASVIATAAAAVYGLIRMHTGKSNFSFRMKFHADTKKWRRIAGAGSPAALNNVFQCLRLITVNGFLYLYGGSLAVAAFTAVNGIAAFAEAVTVGVPQAGSAMLGVYHGERDNGSTKILLKMEWRFGVMGCIVFGVLIAAGSELIRSMYGLSGISLTFPLVCLGISLVPGLWNSMMSGFYNVTGYSALANLIIVCRVYLVSAAAIWFLGRVGFSIWLFLPLGELATVIVWVLATGLVHKKKTETTRFLLMDTTLQRSGRVLNFSVPGNTEEICSACERISDFCAENGMSPKLYMKISLSMEELMTLLINDNPEKNMVFDLRVFSLQGTTGIRIRYGGKLFDPVHEGDHEDEAFMGFCMIEKLVEQVIYRQTFGVNTLLILV